MNAKRLWMGLTLCMLSSAAVAAAPACQPRIELAWIRAAPPGATVLAAYATFKNPCAKAVAVSDVSGADFGMAMIHATTVENGMSRMRAMGALSIPAGGETVLAPGGTHIMLMQPKRELHEGDKVRLALKLSDGRVLSAEFVVRRDPL
jgi:copper(I)-binding protein